MNKFKRKSLSVALAAGVAALGMAGSASAVHVNPDGLGQVLIFPYYTVRNAVAGNASGQYNTYVSVTNTTSNYKAVKVRFLEGKDSREVLDFNVFMSPKDEWAAALVPTSDGTKIILNPNDPDKSCTWGVIQSGGQPFFNGTYSGTYADGEDQSMDRNREGYIEMLEMGTIDTYTGNSQASALITTITHVAGVAPCSTTVLTAADSAGLSSSNGSTGYLSYPTGGLFGGVSLINPANGTDYSYDAVALDNWSTSPHGSNSANISPTIASGDVAYADVFAYGGNNHLDFSWETSSIRSRDAVSAAIMRDNVMNEYVLDSNTLSATDWVVTFPTKRFYVGLDGGNSTIAGNASLRPHSIASGYLFNENFGVGGSCDDVTVNWWDRDEQTPGSGGFSGGNVPGNKLCWEANVISFNQSPVGGKIISGVLGSINTANVNPGFQHGWMNIGFHETTYQYENSLWANSDNYSIAGLPVVGFMVQDFVNGNLNGVQSNYGGNFNHKYTRNIECCLTSP